MGLGTRCLAGPQSLPFLFAENATEMAELAGPLQPLAAIHHDHFAVDVAGTVAHEERGKIGEFLDRAEPPHGIALLSRCFHVRTGQQARESAFGRNWTGRDGVRANAAISPLHCQTARQRLYSALADS